MSFEESLIKNASPTLASIKMASLYSFRFHSSNECKNTLQSFNQKMNPKGIFIELLKNEGDFYLIYVYRKSHLLAALENKNVKDFLKKFGYSSCDNLEHCFFMLKSRLCEENDFPHEIGIFLGYPLYDVKAFIENEGRDCIFCGDWKVYHNEEKAKVLFCKYRHCKEVYIKAYSAGRKLNQMLVSA